MSDPKTIPIPKECEEALTKIVDSTEEYQCGPAREDVKAIRAAIRRALDEQVEECCKIVEAKRCEILTRSSDPSPAFTEDFAEIQISLRALKGGGAMEKPK